MGDFPEDVAGDAIDDPALGAHVFDQCEKEFRRFLGGDESQVMRSTVTWAWFRPEPGRVGRRVPAGGAATWWVAARSRRRW